MLLENVSSIVAVFRWQIVPPAVLTRCARFVALISQQSEEEATANLHVQSATVRSVLLILQYVKVVQVDTICPTTHVLLHCVRFSIAQFALLLWNVALVRLDLLWEAPMQLVFQIASVPFPTAFCAPTQLPVPFVRATTS